ncbi:MAG: preprotein translocase subunit YajC [Planctomycetaceae bacterium]|jgi:preprotein translocase subunit YajC|nr:preprotein translocase subunit YajC [Planctomycetaceae bacterium]
MITGFADLNILFAQAVQENKPQDVPNYIQLIIICGAIAVFFWFFMIRPQQRQETEAKRMIDSLKQHDEVCTVGGIIGTIYSIDKDKGEVVLKLDDSNGTKVKFAIQAIHSKYDKNKKN